MPWKTKYFAELKANLDLLPIGKTTGTILGVYDGKIVSLPTTSRLNKHTAIYGASGTGKSRCIVLVSSSATYKHNALSNDNSALSQKWSAFSPDVFFTITSQNVWAIKQPWEIYRKAGDTVKGNVIIGLGSRIQVFQADIIRKFIK